MSAQPGGQPGGQPDGQPGGQPGDIDPAVAAARADRRRAARVGALALVSVAILVALLVVTGPLSVVRGRHVDVDFAFAGPIKPGASVRIAGVVVGAVRGVDLLAGQDLAAGPDKMVRVRAAIEERAAKVVTERARFRVTTLGVLGEHYLDVEPIAGGTPLADGARVDGESGARPDLLLSRAAGLLERADALLPSSPEALALMRSMSSLMSRLDGLLAGSPANAPDAGTADDVRGLIADLRGLIHGAAVGVGDGASLRRAMDRLPGVLDKTAHLEDTLDAQGIGPLLAEARASLERLDRTLELVSAAPVLDPQKQEQLRLELQAALRTIDVAGQRADRLMGAVENSKGAAGKLFWDEATADDLKNVLHGLRENPVRFFLGRDK